MEKIISAVLILSQLSVSVSLSWAGVSSEERQAFNPLVAGYELLKAEPSYKGSLTQLQYTLKALNKPGLDSQEKSLIARGIYNPVLNATAFSKLMNEITLGAFSKSDVFSMVLGEENPDANFPYKYAENENIDETHLYSAITQAAESMAFAEPTSKKYTLRRFKDRLLLENEKALFRAYWTYQGRYVKALPDTDKMVPELFKRRLQNWEWNELKAVSESLRAELSFSSADRKNNREKLKTRLNEAQKELLALRRLAPSRLMEASKISVDTVGHHPSYSSWNAISFVDLLFQSYPKRPELLNKATAVPSIVGQSSVPLWLYDFDKAVRHINIVGTGFCEQSFSENPLSEQSEALKIIFERLHPTKSDRLLHSYQEYVRSKDLPLALNEGEGDGCKSAIAPYGYNRKKFFLDFLKQKYVERFSPKEKDLRYKFEELSPWKLDGSFSFLKRKAQWITAEPLLGAEALLKSYQPDTYVFGSSAANVTKIEDKKIQAALEQQKAAVAQNFEIIHEFYKSTDTKSVLIKIIDSSPTIALRLMARDWGYISLFKKILPDFLEWKLDPAVPADPVFYGGLIAGGIALVCTIGGGIEGIAAIGDGVVGLVLLFTGTAAGLYAGGTYVYHALQTAGILKDQLDMVRNNLLSGLDRNGAGSQVRSEKLYSDFIYNVQEAILMALLLPTDILLISKVYNGKNIKAVMHELKSSPALKGLLVSDDILRGIYSFMMPEKSDVIFNVCGDTLGALRSEKEKLGFLKQVRENSMAYQQNLETLKEAHDRLIRCQKGDSGVSPQCVSSDGRKLGTDVLTKFIEYKVTPILKAQEQAARSVHPKFLNPSMLYQTVLECSMAR